MDIVDFETNGLDLQTIIGPTNNNMTHKLLKLQESIDSMNISDHLRIVLKKKIDFT